MLSFLWKHKKFDPYEINYREPIGHTMIDRIETHPTAEGYNNINLRSGKDRRKGYSMIDPDLDRRKRDRRKNDKLSGD